MKKVKNILCKDEEIVKILLKENPKINYWCTLKIPERLELGKLELSYIKKFFFEVFCNNLIRNNIIKFIIGVIEENTWEKGYFHAHVLIESVKNEHNFFSCWAEVLIANFNLLNKNKENNIKSQLFFKNIKENIKEYIYIENITQNAIAIKMHYMFKYFGYNINCGFFCYPLNKEIIKQVYTYDYKKFQYVKIENMSHGFILLIYAIQSMFEKDLNIDQLIRIITQHSFLINDIVLSIDNYLLEKKDYFMENNIDFNKLIMQLAQELIKADFLFLLKPSYSLQSKENVIIEIEENYLKDENIIQLKNYIDDNIKDYIEYGKLYLIRITDNIKQNKNNILDYNKWLKQLETDNSYFFKELIFNLIDWVFGYIYEINNDIKLYTRIELIYKFKNILSYSLSSLNKKKKCSLLEDENKLISFFYFFINLLEKVFKYKELLIPIKFKNKENNIVTKYMWNNSKNKILNNLLKQNKGVLDYKYIKELQLLDGTFFLPPKNWVINDLKVPNYTGIYILNNVFKFEPLFHVDILNKTEFNYGLIFIENLNKYQNQSFLLNKNIMTYITSHANELNVLTAEEGTMNKIRRIMKRKMISKEISEEEMKAYWKKEGIEKKEIIQKIMKKMREQMKEKYIKLIKGKEIWYGVFCDTRGRMFGSGVLNYQNEKIIRYMITFKKGYRKENKEEIKKEIEGKIEEKEIVKWINETKERPIEEVIKEIKEKEESKIKKIIMLMEIVREKKEYYINKWIKYSDANQSGRQITAMIFKIEETYKKYFMEEKQEKNYDYYREVLIQFIKGEGDKYKEIISKDEKKWRNTIKRAVMTLIYRATSVSMIKYIREGMIEEKLEKNEELVIAFVKYINKLEESKMLQILEKIIKNIIKGKKKEEILQILKVQAFQREIKMYYVQEKKEEQIRKIFSKRKKITIRKETNKTDEKKIARAFFVNVVHFLDAGLAWFISNELLKQNKNIIMIHDCFGTLYGDNIIEELYIEGLKNEEKNLVFFKLFKSLIQYLEKYFNEIKDKKEKTKEEIVFLNIFKEDFVKILKEIKKKENILKWKITNNTNLLKEE